MPDFNEYYGNVGKILRVDLSSGEISSEDLPHELARKYVGGRGLGAKMLFDELAPGVDPLSPENIFIICTGPLVAAPYFGVKHVLITKSPQTGGFLDAYCGGNFASELKFAGYDVIVIKGKAVKPVYLYVGSDRVEIRDAGSIWGKGCFDAEDMLKEDVGDEDARVAVIGPGGEKLVKYAHVSTDYYHSAGRGGAGAVMGSKNLKAVVARGKGDVRFYDQEALLDFVNNEINSRIANNPNSGNAIKYGKGLTMINTNLLGFCPTRNYLDGFFDRYEEIDGPAMREKIVVSDKGCYGCNVPCGKYSVVTEGPYKGTRLVGPEYETLCLLGSNCEISDLNAIMKSNELCDDLGVDTISAGNAIAFAIECYEKGIITSEDTGGIELKFGDADCVHKMIAKISYREDIGDVLAEGVKIASEKLGKDSKDFAVHSKGMEFAAYDPRGVTGMALAYAVCDRGGCHRRASPVMLEKGMERFTHEGRAELYKRLYDQRIPMHCASVCDTVAGLIGQMNAADFARVLTAATGYEYTEEDMKALCERVATLCLLFNLREGAPFTKEENLSFWPKRMTEDPVLTGPSKGQVVSLEKLKIMLEEYYALRGWDIETGIPTLETVQRVDLAHEGEIVARFVKLPGGDRDNER